MESKIIELGDIYGDNLDKVAKFTKGKLRSR